MNEPQRSGRRRTLYVAKYDYPRQGVTAGQVFERITEVPVDVVVEPRDHP